MSGFHDEEFSMQDEFQDWEEEEEDFFHLFFFCSRMDDECIIIEIPCMFM